MIVPEQFEEFLEAFDSNPFKVNEDKAFRKQLIENIIKYRYCAVVIGDKYANSQIVPLGFHCMNLFLQKGFMMKAILVKNFDKTRGKMNQKAIWRYRALASDFYR